MAGLVFQGVVRCQAGNVGMKDKATNQPLPVEQYKYPVYMPYMGGQVYANATPEAHAAIGRQTPPGSRDGADMLIQVEVSKFREDTIIRILDASVPGGVNPGGESARVPTARRV